MNKTLQTCTKELRDRAVAFRNVCGDYVSQIDTDDDDEYTHYSNQLYEAVQDYDRLTQGTEMGSVPTPEEQEAFKERQARQAAGLSAFGRTVAHLCFWAYVITLVYNGWTYYILYGK